MNLIYLFLLIPFFIYWCINEKAGLQIGITVIICIWTVQLYRNFRESIPIDIDLTWIIVIVIFCLDLFLGKKISVLLSKGSVRAYMITAAVVSFLMILYHPSVEYVIPGGILLGLSIGCYLNRRYVGFTNSDIWKMKGIKKWLIMLARFFLGTVVLAIVIYRVDQIMLQISNSQYILIYGFLCYVVMSLWVFVAAPWVFVKLHLAGLNENDSTGNNDK